MNPAELIRKSEKLAARGNLEEAIRLLEQVSAQIETPGLHRTLATLNQELCRIPKALEHLDRALAQEPDDAQRVRRALMLPPMMGSRDEIQGDRDRLQRELEGLLSEGLHIDDPLHRLPNLGFYLAYHGMEDRALRRLMARVLRGACPSLRFTAEHCMKPAPPLGRKIKVGFVSANFASHTIGRLNRELVARLDRKDFEVTLFFAHGIKDRFAEEMAESADRAVSLPFDLEAGRARVAEEKLDLLYYTDIGMELYTYLLAFARLAPVQCATWGHPLTTGLETMDWFVSGDSLEVEGADSFYSERLARLTDPTVCYPLPELDAAPGGAEIFGLPSGTRTYLCPQSLFKMHPDFDPTLAEILRRDPEGHLLFPATRPRAWQDMLVKRLEAIFPNAPERITFLSRTPRNAFLQQLASANVILDPFHFGGGHTTLEAMAVGAPVITLPGKYLRGRLTQAWYRTLQIHDCLAKTPEAYATLALALARNPEKRAAISSRILEAGPRLFNQESAIINHERFFKKAIQEATP